MDNQVENSCSLIRTKPTRRLSNVGENPLMNEIGSVCVDQKCEYCHEAREAPSVERVEEKALHFLGTADSVCNPD